MKKLTTLFLSLYLLLVLASTVSAQAGNAALQRGIAAYQAEDYDTALAEFKEAAMKSPSNTPIQLWLGMAHAALDDGWKADDIWRAGIGNEKWESTVWALKGLGFWKRNDKSNAAYYFKQCERSKPGYQTCRALLEKVTNDEDMPPVSEWGRITGLLQGNGRTPVKNVPQKSVPQSDELAPPDVARAASGVKPRGGLFRGTITNQKGNQTITFRVSPDGSTVSDVTFTGYWRCPSAMNPTQSTRNAPPGVFVVTGGAFSEVKREPAARLWYELIGSFNSGTTATGTLRIAYAGGECDTHKLQWSATRTGR